MVTQISWRLAAAALMPAFATATVDASEAKVQISEWQVPFENSRPRDPFVDPHGRVWFCGQTGAYLAYFDAGSETFVKHDLADGAGPHNLIIDHEGQVWFAANTLPYIGRLDPVDGVVTRFPMPENTATDPHTLAFNDDGDIWFTAQRSNYVGRLDKKTGKVDVIKVDVPRARPYGIRIDSTGQPWVALFGTNKLARVDPESLEMTIYDLPREKTRVRRIEIDSDDRVWYGDYAKGRLGRLDPATGEVTEWAMPGGENARPYGSVIDADGMIWIAEGGSPNRLVAFDTRSEKFVSVTDIPQARGAIRNLYLDPQKREIWFGEDSNFIGRATLPGHE